MYEIELDAAVPIPIAQDKEYLTQRRRLDYAENTLDEMPDYGVRGEKNIQYKEPDDVTPHELLIAEATGRELPAEMVRGLLRCPVKVREARRLISDFDGKVVETAASIRNYVTTRLVLESDHKDPKIRLAALQMLGKITDVALFTEKTEINVNNRSSKDLEEAIRAKIYKFITPGAGAGQVEDARVRKVSLRDEIEEAQAQEIIQKTTIETDD